MSLFGKLIRTAVVAAALAVTVPVASAQELSAAHVALALEVVKSAGASRGFDNVLPTIAEQVTGRFIRVRPDLHKQIQDAVEAVATKLAARRTDLDNDVARIWAKHFTEEELQSLLEFYTSPAGKKFSETGPLVLAEAYTAVDRWSNRVGEELLEKTREELKGQGIEF